MARTLTIPEPLYDLLQEAAARRGLAGIEDLLERLGSSEQERARREAMAQRAASIRSRIFDAVGEMPDSTALVREDRDR